ncbi:selenium cofactor biosynthesis protein YqeC [Megasphaera vaginalis (ex Bordigoni et al. 2020)]|uniref:selenium cofactor biosynthesis protein YqeC n=1 Tax=Megasphaera vaginalis (ex Bordigoni et al. 2020) TaxID=2045301 RepID=UPI000C79BE54|nr:selenium cofactor biosynthesis protein YqeC [Megasphaera vaginalis (ex Bordigoni et al. 2020)]
MVEDKRWRRLLHPGITAIVGAGGKTTVLERLGKYGHTANLPIMISTTVSVNSDRVDNVRPFDVICTGNIEEGEAFCAERIAAGRVPAWFRNLTADGLYEGLEAQTIDYLKSRHPAWYILIEADASRHKWLKAPQADDIPLPQTCDTLIGVLNLQMLSSPLSEERVDGVDTAAAIMGRPIGAVLTPALLAKLVKHPRGMFRGMPCARVLFCTGYNAVQHRMTEALLDELDDLGLSASVLADGYRETCTIRQYIAYDNLDKKSI